MLDPVTSRYADALFGIAKRSQALDAVRADVSRLDDELRREDGVGGLVFDARIPLEERRQKIQPLTGGMHELTRNFLNLVFDKRREEVLRGLGSAFHERWLVEEGAAEGIVESARPLDAAELQSLAGSIGGQLQKRVSLENRVHPELMGGVRVIVGSRMVDSSVSGRLGDLKKAMLDAPLPGSSGASTSSPPEN